MIQPGSERLRRWAVAGTVALIGIALSASAYSRVRAQETSAASQSLADAGKELARAAADLHLATTAQALAIQGLFESRSVTNGQFSRFTTVIGTALDNRLDYAPMVPSAEVKEFVDQARLSRPGFSIYGNDVDPVDEYWPLLYTTAEDGVGYRPGFDFGSDPAIRAAIERGIVTGRPVASRFLTGPGNEESGVFVVIAVIRRNSLPDGIAVATLHLDDLLQPRLHDLLGNTATLHMVNMFYPDAPHYQTSTSWTTTLNLAGQLVGLQVEVAEESVTIGSASSWLLGLGLTISLLTGWMSVDRSRRRAMVQQVSTLVQTLADKDRFLASVSHELRTPLTAVVGALELLGPGASIGPEAQGVLLEDARNSASELERLVEDYLTAARISGGTLTLKLGIVDLDVLVARILTGIERPARVSMRVGELGSCRGDPVRIRQIIRNLIRNANRFARSEIEVRAIRAGDFATILIVNDGEPVPLGVIGRLFDPFVKGTNPGQPDTIGLGLFVSRDLAVRMGGALSYSFEHDKVVFSLSLPAAGPILASPGAPDTPPEDLAA